MTLPIDSFTPLLEQVRQFITHECIALEQQVDRDDAIPESLVGRMRALGLFGHSIPQEYGGVGLSTEQLARVNIEVSQAATTFRARFGGNTGIASESLVVDGTLEQKQRWLPQLASGAVTGCFALTESEAGSDATAMRIFAERDGDDYLISGTKCFITNAPIAELFTVFARTEAGTKGAKGARRIAGCDHRYTRLHCCDGAGPVHHTGRDT
jgi:acyl-CoA dehydrogenase